MLKKMPLIILFLFIVSLTGCYDSKEPDEWAYIYNIGIDKGVKDKLRLTIQIPTARGQSSEGGGGLQGSSQMEGKNESVIMSVDCPTIFEGANMLNTSLARTLNFMHTEYILISEDVARDGLEELANSIQRARQLRRTMHFIVVKGKASEFIKEFNPVLGIALSKMQITMMEQAYETSLFIDTLYSEFLNDMKSPKGQASCTLAGINDFSSYMSDDNADEAETENYTAGEVPRIGGNTFEFMGTALFDGDKMIGELTGSETRALLILKNKFKASSYTVAIPGEPSNNSTLQITLQKPTSVKITFEEDRPIINVSVFIEGSLVHLQSSRNFEGGKLRPILEDAYKNSIKNLLDKTIEKCKNLNCDVFGFGAKASAQFSTIQELEQYNWNEHFKDAEITTDVKVVIRRVGEIMKTTLESGTDNQ